jgi:predicted O-methyltransferase YrrM
VRPDPALEAALAASAAAGLPPIQVSPAQGKLLMLLAEIKGARTILEIGTLGGYSSIWLARALPADGLLTTLEVEPKHAEAAAERHHRADRRQQGLRRLRDRAGHRRPVARASAAARPQPRRRLCVARGPPISAISLPRPPPPALLRYNKQAPP